MSIEIVEFYYLPLSHDEMPLEVTLEIEGRNIILDFDYNKRGDFYTLTAIDEEDNLLFTNKLTPMINTLETVTQGIDLATQLVPLSLPDISREFPEVNHVGRENLATVRLCLL